MQAYLKAMERVAQRHPQDDAAQIYYALALVVAASLADKSYDPARAEIAAARAFMARVN